MNFLFLAIFGLLIVLLPFSQAEGGYDYKFDPKPVKIGQFESEVGDKLARGITNLVFGWTEMIRTPVEWGERTETGAFKAVTLGIPYGILRGPARTVVGLYEIVTCYAPQKPIMASIEGDVV